MLRHSRRVLLVLILGLIVLQSPAKTHAASCRLIFRVTLARDVAKSGASGRLLVFMTNSKQEQERLSASFAPGSTWFAATEVEYFGPGSTVEIDPDRVAFPHPFSQAPPDSYQFMALLDPDHTYVYSGQNGGDLTSHVIKIENLNPADAPPVQLTLDRVTPGSPKLVDTESVKLVEIQSPLLTAFWGRPITMRAGVVLITNVSEAAR